MRNGENDERRIKQWEMNIREIKKQWRMKRNGEMIKDGKNWWGIKGNEKKPIRDKG